MVFSSIEFLLYFLPVFFILYGMTPSKYRNITLLTGSLVFYTYGEPDHLILLLVSVLINYFICLHLGADKVRKISKSERYNDLEILNLTPKNALRDILPNKRKNRKKRRFKRKRVLFIAAVIGNIGMLAFFKIKGGASGLPLGISFYTFQILSCLIDVYRGEIPRENSFLKFASYITMFPQLVSGPIVSYGEVREELNFRTYSIEGVQDGLKLFTMGLVSKVLLADRVGLLWREAQVTGFESISQIYAWLAAIAFSMKIYFDFYGYSLMAVGLGRMMGFNLPENFRTPYMARSVRDFYRRWHITLGRWFCRYVYIPLGGNRRGELRTICNLFLVWLLTSVWHGSTLNFLIWGGILWLCITLERLWDRTGLGGKMKVLPHLYLWLVIPVTWMCFAITDTGQLGVYLGRMTGLFPGINVRSGDWIPALRNYGYLLGISFAACTPLVQKIYRRIKDTAAGTVILAVLFWICVWRITLEGNNPFMYFSF